MNTYQVPSDEYRVTRANGKLETGNRKLRTRDQEPGTMDKDFLSRHFGPVERPLAQHVPATRVLFTPGVGLGLGDQFMCLALVRALEIRFPTARIDLLIEYEDFWRPRISHRVRLLPIQSSLDAGLSDDGYDVKVLGYLPGRLAELAQSHAPTVFCAGENLNDYRSFYAAGGLCNEIPLTTCREAVAEGDKFLALFHDFGVITYSSSQSPCVDWNALTFDELPASLAGARIFLHPGAGKEYKRWPLENWIELARRLTAARAELSVSSGDSDPDRRLAQTLAEAVPGVRCISSVALEMLLGLLRDFDLVLSADTFLPHAIATEGGPLSLAVYGPTDPFRYCPNSPKHFFIAPLAVSPQQFYDAIHALFALCSGDLAEIAVPGCEMLLIRASHALTGLLRELPVFATNSLWRWQVDETLRVLGECFDERHRLLLIGGDELYLRLRRSIASDPLGRVVQMLRQSPVWRAAQRISRFAVAQPRDHTPVPTDDLCHV
ncbi:MAG: glycosyltransferase family 9 protein [Candidatus Hydrogenedentes bacterium]|nr:glycosyltransferase family 9 protein [Candidatus Hydrogenedentota bacterium]